MEFLEGMTLQYRITGKPLQTGSLLALGIDFSPMNPTFAVHHFSAFDPRSRRSIAFF
jgi:hypothetical protein